MKYIPHLLIAVLLCSACIGTDVLEDYVEASVSIDNPIISLKLNGSYQFTATYRNNVGDPEAATFVWRSSDESVLRIDSDGLATGIDTGEAVVYATSNGTTDSLILEVSDTTIFGNNVRIAELKTVSSYPLSGNATLKKERGIIILSLTKVSAPPRRCLVYMST